MYYFMYVCFNVLHIKIMFTSVFTDNKQILRHASGCAKKISLSGQIKLFNNNY